LNKIDFRAGGNFCLNIADSIILKVDRGLVGENFHGIESDSYDAVLGNILCSFKIKRTKSV
jgi:hypothetical protein